MGYYINPPDMSKEAFLEAKGIRLPQAPEKAIEDDLVAVCLVDNFAFTAAAIAYDDSELAVFKTPDGRSKKWYLVEKKDLVPYCGLFA